ncbi:DUF4238 domain-containing protein [Thioalkalivibrio sp. ALR17-21]|uniref:DUF4238 domain-containing protein n=1 Tax=Thioalkalivibrio sp. ALR17-21 TaxID=1269813 RepID=UPI0012DC6047|nr:DUF4238 domain-containing protein [Thioalkalivibrio sp. ALR17-21]
MKYEKTQKGNPYQLTVNQHCFPARSIERFADSSQRVEVCLLNKDKNFKATPTEKVFCARRAWDQRAESGFMKAIEDEYQALADKVVAGYTSTLDETQQVVVSKMFALWNTRWHWANTPVEDQEIKGAIGVAVEYSKDEQEQLEKAGVAIIRPDLTISGRHFTGTSIQRNIDLVMEQLSDARWGILTCDDGEFLVPDTASTLRYVPVTPSICFFSQSLDEKITGSELEEINQEVISGASAYYFGKNLP